MNKYLKIAKQIYAQIVQIDNKEYEKAMYDYYDNKQFVDYTLKQDNYAEQMFKNIYPPPAFFCQLFI